jgi:hypothetical protein
MTVTIFTAANHLYTRKVSDNIPDDSRKPLN